MDKDKSGTLDLDEIRDMIKTFSVDNSCDVVAREVMKELDLSGDGGIDFTEFCKFMLNVKIKQETTL